MSKTQASGLVRRRTVSLAAALAVSAGLLMFGLVALAGGGSGPATSQVGAKDLAVSWARDGSSVIVAGTGFRVRSVVTAKIGDVAAVQAPADAAGSVRVEVPVDLATTGHQGTSVVLAGRSQSGSARTLVSAVPPRAAGHGPVDLAPWSVGAALVVVAVATVRDRRFAIANINAQRLQGHHTGMG
jgi:hypothetical protein